MSWDTQAWAAKQRPGSASAKLVLLALASCSDQNHCAFPSIDWLCDFSDLNRKTVIEALKRLGSGLFPLIADTGRRVGKSGQIKVYRLAADDAESGTVPKTGQSQKRNSPDFSSKQSQKRDTEPVLEPITPSEDKSSDVPLGDEMPGEAEGKQAPEPAAQPEKPKRQRNTGERISADWTPPPIADLPRMARGQASQWPAGAYETVAEAFHNHWLSEGRSLGRKLDWSATWAKWVVSESAAVMRAARSGVTFATPAQRAASTAPVEAKAPVASKCRECPRSAAIHAALRATLGERSHAQFLAHVAIVVGREAVEVVAPTHHSARWLEEHFGAAIERAAQEVVAGAYRGLRFEVEPMPEAEAA